MKKRVVVLMVMACMSLSLVACGKKEEVNEQDATEAVVEDVVEDTTDAATEEVAEDVADESSEEPVGDMGLTDDFPDNFMEERTGKFVFDSCDDVIANLQPGEAYGYAKVLGSDEEVLFITPETFDGYGFPAAIESYVYLPTADGKYQCESSFSSASTSTPISVSEEGYILTATHTEVSCMAIDKNTQRFMCVVNAYVEYGEDGSETYGGFYRDTNDVNSECKEIAADDSSVFESSFAKFTDTNAVHFTVVK